MKNEQKEQRAAYFQTWYQKPGNKEAKQQSQKEAYQYRKSIGICPLAGCQNDPVDGHVLCAKHRDYRRKRNKVVA